MIASLAAGAALVLCAGSVRAAEHTPPTTPAIKAYATVLHGINPQLPSWQSRSLARRVLNSAAHWRLDPNLLVALVTVESRWHTHARSSVGALGLGQLMPGTAQTLHVDPRNPEENISGAARYLSGLLDRFKYHHNRFELACAAYNAGPQAVSRYGGIPPYSETQHYVVRVMRTWKHIASTVHIPRSSATGGVSADVAYWTGG